MCKECDIISNGEKRTEVENIIESSGFDRSMCDDGGWSAVIPIEFGVANSSAVSCNRATSLLIDFSAAKISWLEITYNEKQRIVCVCVWKRKVTWLWNWLGCGTDVKTEYTGYNADNLNLFEFETFLPK